MNYFLYEIRRPIETNDLRKYIGITCCLNRRFKQHKTSKTNIGNFIKQFPDVDIFILETFNTLEQVLEREAELVPNNFQERLNLLLLNQVGGGGLPPIKFGNKHALGTKLTKEEKQRRSEKMKIIASKRSSDYYNKMVSTRKRNENLGLYKKNMKIYSFLSPQNEIIEISNLKQFCKDNNLNYPSMVEVSKQKRPSHKGFKKIK